MPWTIHAARIMLNKATKKKLPTGSTACGRLKAHALCLLVLLIFKTAFTGICAPAMAIAGSAGTNPAVGGRSNLASSGHGVILTPGERRWLSRKAGQIRIGITVIPPEVIGGNGQYKGLSIDYIHLMERKLRCGFKLVPYLTWYDVIQAAKARRIDVIFAAQETPERREYLLFTEPYIELPNMIVVRKDRQGGADLKDMRGWRVAASNGSAVHEFLNREYPDLELYPVPDELSGLLKVSMGEADAMVVETSRASYYIGKAGILNLRVSGKAGLQYRLRFAVRNDWPVLRGILDKGLAAVTEEEKQALNRRWIVIDQKGTFTTRRFWIMFGAGLAMISLAVTGVVLWNRTLRSVVRQRTAQLQQELIERRQVEEALRGSEQQYRTLLENVPEFIVRYDRNLRRIYVNPAWEKAAGLSAGEAIGADLTDIAGVPGPTADEYVNKRRLAMETGESQAVDFTWVNADGEVLFLEYVIVPEYDHQGRIAGVLAVGRDISERKQMEKERLAHLRYFENMDRVNRAIQGAGNLDAMMRDLVGIVLEIFDCDRAFLMYPCDPEAATWNIPMECNKPDYPGVRERGLTMPMDPQVAETLRILLAADGPVVFGPGTPHAMPENVAEQFGIKRFMSMAVYPKTGSPWQFGIHQCADARIWSSEEQRLFREIGRRLSDGLSAMLAFRELRNSLEKLEQAQRIAHIGSWELDLINNDLKWSDEVFRIFEVDPERFAVSYDAFLDSVHPEDREAVDSAYTSALRSRTPYAIDHRLYFPDGRVKYVHVQCETTYEDDRPIRSMGTVQDITERKRLEEQLRQSQKLEAVGQLAGGVAHDFNNMLGVITGHAELALDDAALDDTLRKNLEEILEAGRRSTEITRQLLAFARRQTIAPKILDLNETVEGILKLLRRLIGEDINLVWLPGNELGAVKMDPAQIDQILANLCVNARDAINGVGEITIETDKAGFDAAFCSRHEGFHPGEYVVLTVGDNGSGMDKPTKEKIFEPFFTTKGVGKGTGMGLATVYGIVKQNAGFIHVTSKPGNGSTFKIYLPRHTATAGQEPSKSPEPPDLQGHETILVVEDEIMHLRMLRRMLERTGYQVLTASSPGEALLLARNHSEGIHLMLTDLIMPEMNGRDLAYEMGSLCPDTACLFMSGYTGDTIADQGILEQGINFIHKPFTKEDLAVKIREVLDYRNRTRE